MTALFLDRDGVINQRIVDGYVTRPDDFLFIDGVLEAMAIFARHFDRIFVVTNQQGIGKGLMTEADLQAVHSYHCPTLKSEHSFMRKPSIGMALRARRDYSDVVLHRSVMVGDMESDMLFGRRARMQTVLVDDQTNLARRNPHLVDLSFPNLISYAQYLEKVTSE